MGDASDENLGMQLVFGRDMTVNIHQEADWTELNTRKQDLVRKTRSSMHVMLSLTSSSLCGFLLQDREDHTFCGIMFPVKCKDLLPLDHVVIHSVSVRGRLGPLTVWVSKEEASPNQQQRSFHMNPRFWDKIYERTHGASFHDYVELDLRKNPIKLVPGQTRAIYIHSTLPGDEAIVYDNRHSRRTYDDALLSILTGRAHVSTRAFGTNPIWGWGNPWRDNREFVGRLEYGAVYRLWNPNEFLNFGDKFQNAARTLFLCQRRWESQLSRLPDECIFYILNMCRWDWFKETPADMKALRKKNKVRAAAAAAAEARMQIDSVEAETSVSVVGTVQAAESSSAEEEAGGSSCCIRRSHQETSDANDEEEDDEEEYHAAREEDSSGDDENEYLEEADGDFEEEEELDEDSDDDEDWDSDNGYGANNEVFQIEDDGSDEEDEVAETPGNRAGNRAWIHRQFARIHVLQALAALDDNGVEEMNH